MSDKLKVLLEGTELSEDFKSGLSGVIEEAIAGRKVELEAEFATKLAEAVEAKTTELESMTEAYIADEVMPEIDKYLTAAVNEWITQNELAVDSGIKVEIAESFLTGMKGLFEESNIQVPSEKMDMYAESQAQVEKLKGELSEANSDKLDAQAQAKELERQLVFKRVTESLADTEVDKLVSLSESIEFDTPEDYETRVTALVESMSFGKPAKEPVVEDQTIDESGKKGTLSFADQLAESAVNCKF